MYTRLFSLLFALLLTVSTVNAVGVLLLDGIESGVKNDIQTGRSSSDNVMFTYLERDCNPQTLVVVSIYESTGSFVKSVTLLPYVSRNTTTFLNDGRYVIKSYNMETGERRSIPLSVH